MMAGGEPGDRSPRPHYPVTPDGRYFIVRGRLWRMSNPALDPSERERLVKDLMSARRAVATAKRAQDRGAEADAHAAVDSAKRALGERGPVWWDDDAPGYNRHMSRTTPYAVWFTGLARRRRCGLSESSIQTGA
jgi:hypothetical protein